MDDTCSFEKGFKFVLKISVNLWTIRSLRFSKDQIIDNHQLDISDNGQFSSSSDLNILDSEIRKRVIIEQNELGKKVYTCRECGKSFLRKDKIDLHVEIHIGGFTHSCELCGTVTKSRKALMNHKYFNHTKKNNLENK